MIVALNIDNKAFVIYVATLVDLTIMLIYSTCRAYVILLRNKKISAKYSDFLDIFSSDSLVRLPMHIGINDHTINLLEDE